jgi:hypothetical protein
VKEVDGWSDGGSGYFMVQLALFRKANYSTYTGHSRAGLVVEIVMRSKRSVNVQHYRASVERNPLHEKLALSSSLLWSNGYLLCLFHLSYINNHNQLMGPVISPRDLLF